MLCPKSSQYSSNSANFSPNSSFFSAPILNAAPERKPTIPSPEASQNSGASITYSVEFWLQNPFIEPIVLSSVLSTSYTAVFNNSVILGSAITLSNKTASNINGLPSLLTYVFSTNISSTTPPSRLHRLLFPRWEVAPNIHSRTSLEEFPPNTGLSCTKTTFTPLRAAVIAVHTPDNPPPMMASSVWYVSLFNSLLASNSFSIIVYFSSPRPYSCILLTFS